MDEHNSETHRRTSARERRGRQKTERTSSNSWIAWVAGVVIGVFVLVVVVDVAASAGRIHPGVSVGGVKVGGMTPSRATSALQLQLPEKASAPVVVRHDDTSWTVAPEDLAISFDYDALVSTAMGVGRGSGLFDDASERAGAWFGSAALPARAIAQPAKLAAVLGKVTSEVDVSPRDARVRFDGTSTSVSSAASGTVVDRPQLTTALLTAFTSDRRQIEAPVRVVQADVSDAAAEAARVVAERMVAQPATVTWKKKSWKLSTDDLADVIAFRKVAGVNGSGWALEPYVAEKRMSKVLTPKLGGKIGRPARDAGFRTRSGTVTIIPAKTGIGPDIAMLSANLTSTLKTPVGQPRVLNFAPVRRNRRSRRRWPRRWESRTESRRTPPRTSRAIALG